MKALPAALWADRTTTKAATGFTPAYMVYSTEVVLPIELQLDTWPYLPWKDNLETSELLALRMQQFDRRNLDLNEAKERMQRVRDERNQRWERRHETTLRTNELQVGDMVLLDNIQKRKEFGKKLNF